MHPSHWEIHPLLGIIHVVGECSTCDEYSAHIITLKNSDLPDTDLNNALHTLWKSRFESYSDGVEEGVRRATSVGLNYPPNFAFDAGVEEGRRQQQARITQLEAERDETLALAADVQVQLRTLKTMIHHAGIILKEASPEPPSSVSSSTAMSPVSYANPSSSPHVSCSATVLLPNTSRHSPTSPASSTTSTWAKVSPSLHTSPMSSPSLPPISPATSSWTAISPSHARHTRIHTSTKSTHSSSTPASPVLPPDQPITRRQHLQLSLDGNDPTMPNQRVLDALRELMRRAHQGDVAALNQVKRLCREAHATPSEHKTYAQNFVLSEWRNPLNSAPGRRPVLAHDNGPHIINPRIDDPVAVWFRYFCVYKSSWPRGVRQDGHGQPVWSDLSASRTFARLRPSPETPSPYRIEFVASMTKLFTTRGGYELTLRKEGYRISPTRDFRPFEPKENAPITTDTVACHFSACGVTLEEACKEIEPWAIQYERKVEVGAGGSVQI
ncbi:hypothetical protein D9758_004031 [Tetrapyrgos nigripes]|uniref:Uncharacterized protein n=1 Tax=Tetrapyrgos nigripes TaxID=182062 RepID=A0A8H5GLH3_9AGAR|nr:hypothetical protein D9758_004031 [Tetrapyrgos nigripes]